MTEHRQKTGLLAAGLILCAIAARVLGKVGVFPVLAGLTRTLLYIGLYMGWGISVSRRILQPQLRRYLAGVAALMVFWFMLRAVKYHFSASAQLSRLLWYGYYLPMLFIPLLAVFVAVSLGRPEEFRLPGWAMLLWAPTLLLLLLVLTNDFHQLVFTFPAGAVWSDYDYGYGAGYYLVMGWEIACALAALVVMFIKCRFAQKNRLLPALLLLGSIVYGLIYVSGAAWMQLIGGDIAAVQCLIFAGIFESCIQCGLIPTNTGYDELFRAGVPGALIADRAGKLCCASAGCPALSPETLRAAQGRVVPLDEGTLLKSHPIDGGFVYWREDIARMAALLKRLEQNRQTLEERNHLARQNYRVRRQILALREKNRLYDLLQRTAAPHLRQLDALFAAYEAADPDEQHRLLARMAVLGAYIKRRGNLVFLSETAGVIDTAELSLCLEESFANLRLLSVECAADLPGGIPVVTQDVVSAYDLFERAVEASLETLRFVWLKARFLADAVVLHFEMECSAPLPPFLEQCEGARAEDGVWRFTLRLQKGVVEP